ncbi:Pfs NACHT and Ankyrin domain protein [Penicillium odoratum]|uniref:Pfs NACHT and Ankyrin domain protein n=1 Tax=Penicillium odoratum TaxID=1167516 RepID=UPI002548F7D3|nr:Pfs NACHT and Ankyrin domain protein [Penicillium odoratum]KAJ5765753.1 Pfs NACHT and Ankyrin domain protein [Penicillium odoratum]
MRTLKRKKGGPTPGTCEWVLRTEELTAWLGSGPTVGPESQPTQVLWLYGNPGTGKSTIALYLTEQLSATFSNTDGKMLAYFFCDSAFDTRKTATSVVKGLLYQLVQQNEELRNHLLSKYHTRGEELFTSFDDLWDIFMTMVADENTGRKYCIIDALDECDRESQDTLLQQLEETFKCPNVSPNARILVTTEGTFLWIGLACGELKDIPSNSVVRTLQNIPKGLNALFQQLLVTALKQSEVSGDDIRHLLSCVAISSRPLTVSELSEACQLHQEEEDVETTLQFTQEYLEDYLVGASSSNFIQELKAHAQLAYRCVDRIIAQFRDTNQPQSGFWYYATQQWAHHARMAELQSSQAEFFQIDSRCREWWLEGVRSDMSVPTVPTRFSIFHVAAKWGICALVNHAAELEFQESDVERTTYIDHVNCTDDFGQTPQEHAARSGFPNISAALLNRGGKVTTEVVSAAAKNPENGKSVLALLLDRRGYQIIITEEVFKAAAGNTWSGEAVLALLLDRYGDKIIITEDVIKVAARNQESGKAVLALLLDRCADQITITEEVVMAAAGNWGSGEAVLALLLDRCGDQIIITEDVIKVAAGNQESGEAVLALLLDRCGDQIIISEDVIKVAAGNQGSGKAVLALLLDRCGDQIIITEEVVKAAADNWGSGEAVLVPLLDCCGDQIIITEEVVKAAARNWWSGEAVLALLLNRCGDQIIITEEVVKAARLITGGVAKQCWYSFLIAAVTRSLSPRKWYLLLMGPVSRRS